MGYKNNKNNQKLTDEQIGMIEHYANKGLGDGVIAEKLGLVRGTVSKYTTNFWKRKMENN